MRLIFMLVLIVGVGLAGMAVFYAKDRFDQYRNALATQRDAIIETTDVVVMNTGLRYGQQLRREDVRVIRWPADSVPFGTFRAIDEVFPEGSDELRTVLRIMERDEPVMLSKVTAPGQDAGVASRLTSGMRAFALRVDVASGVSGFIRPGDRVDVYWSGESREGNVTRLIEASLQIIAVDQVADEDRNNPMVARTLTVEARPDRIAALAQAQATGSLSLALVGVNDDIQSEIVQAGQNEILGIVEAAPAQAARVCTVRSRRGGDVVVVPVRCTN
mgnify:CR=1 FL=1